MYTRTYVAFSCGRRNKGETAGAFQASGDKLGWNMNTLRHLTKLQDTDLLYASFVSEVCVTSHHPLSSVYSSFTIAALLHT